MNVYRRFLALVIVVAAAGLGACTTQEAKTGGTGGRGGSTVPSGSGGMYATSDGVLCPLPTRASITDFTYVVTDAAVVTDTSHFGDATTLGGSEFYYPTLAQNPTYPVTSDVTGNSWHMTGNLGTYSGFGLYFDNCTHVDASAYRGISFTISGSVPMGNMVTMGMGTLANVIPPSWLAAHPVAGSTPPDPAAPGRCIPVSGTNQFDQPSCKDATHVVQVTATATPQTVLWGDFTGGLPQANVTPSDITSIYWFFPPPVGAGTATPTPYMVDITIDDLAFVP